MTTPHPWKILFATLFFFFTLFKESIFSSCKEAIELIVWNIVLTDKKKGRNVTDF